jgi:hypothetical protein
MFLLLRFEVTQRPRCSDFITIFMMLIPVKDRYLLGEVWVGQRNHMLAAVGTPLASAPPRILKVTIRVGGQTNLLVPVLATVLVDITS